MTDEVKRMLVFGGLVLAALAVTIGTASASVDACTLTATVSPPANGCSDLFDPCCLFPVDVGPQICD